MKTTRKQKALIMRGSQVDMLLHLSKNLTLFHDQNGTGFVFLKHETMPLRSKKMKRYLTKLLWDAIKEAPEVAALTRTLDVLEAKAIFDCPEVFLFNRVGKGVQGDIDSFFYDLGDGKAVKITPQGWTVGNAPILFRHYSHQRSQVTPIKGGTPWALFKVVNVESEYQLLFLIKVISCFIPHISHPVIDLSGDQGSGKTTDSTMVRDVVDPSIVKAQSIPKDLKELVQVLSHHYFPVFDNVSSLPDWVSDVFCQASTGGGLSKRKLFTDDEDVVYQFRRCIVLNGIHVPIHKPDLLDRSILFPLERIPKEKRKTDEQLWAEFEYLKPSILGGIFDVLSKAMRIYPAVRLSWTPRMADFGAWGFAIGEALEVGAGEKFLETYRNNIERQIEEIIQTNALAQAVLSFMEDKEQWQGTIGEAWKSLYKIAGPYKDPSFPRNERTLRKHLATVKPSLQHFGISYQVFARTKNGYPITVTRNPKKVDSFASSPEFDNGNKELSGERTGEGN